MPSRGRLRQLASPRCAQCFALSFAFIVVLPVVCGIALGLRGLLDQPAEDELRRRAATLAIQAWSPETWASTLIAILSMLPLSRAIHG